MQLTDYEIIIRPKSVVEFESLEDLRRHVERLRANKQERDYHREQWELKRFKALQRWVDIQRKRLTEKKLRGCN